MLNTHVMETGDLDSDLLLFMNSFTIKTSQMFYQLFFLHSAAGTVSFILDVCSPLILYYSTV